VLAEAAQAGARAGTPLRLSEAQSGTAFVGDVDAWQAQWSLLGALRPRSDLVFDGCSLADYRAISRRRDLPPPLAPNRGRVWVLRPDGTVHRATLRATAV
jgi:S-DNA-T family DNA segregation ATPase FtsK/SpoIIIE